MSNLSMEAVKALKRSRGGVMSKHTQAETWCRDRNLDGGDWPRQHLFEDFGSRGQGFDEWPVWIALDGEDEPSRAYGLHIWPDGSGIMYQGDIWTTVEPSGRTAMGIVLDWAEEESKEAVT